MPFACLPLRWAVDCLAATGAIVAVACEGGHLRMHCSAACDAAHMRPRTRRGRIAVSRLRRNAVERGCCWPSSRGMRPCALQLAVPTCRVLDPHTALPADAATPCLMCPASPPFPHEYICPPKDIVPWDRRDGRSLLEAGRPGCACVCVCGGGVKSGPRWSPAHACRRTQALLRKAAPLRGVCRRCIDRAHPMRPPDCLCPRAALVALHAAQPATDDASLPVCLVLSLALTDPRNRSRPCRCSTSRPRLQRPRRSRSSTRSATGTSGEGSRATGSSWPCSVSAVPHAVRCMGIARRLHAQTSLAHGCMPRTAHNPYGILQWH